MKTMLKAVGVAVVSMSALALGGVATPALAQTLSAPAAQEVHIPVADLNLNTPEGAAKFDTRVRTVADQICSDQYEIGLGVYDGCVRAVREEANDNLRQQLDQLALQGSPNYADAAQAYAYAAPAPR